MDHDHLYGTIARALRTICPAGFREARMDAEVEDDWTEKTYRYRDAGGWSQGVPVEASLDFAVDDALMALREGMAQAGRPKWRSCTFSLGPDGGFAFDVAYPGGDDRA